MKKTIQGLFKLSHFSEYASFVIIATIFGASAARVSIDWRISLLILANWMSVGFAFMINEIRGAPDDVLLPQNPNRNPISAGLISPQTAKRVTFATSLLSFGLFAWLGLWPLSFGVIILLLGYYYSTRRVRLKIIAFRDILSHSLMMAGLPFLTAYFAFNPKFNRNWFWPFIFIFAIRVYGELQQKTKTIGEDHPSNHPQSAGIFRERVRIFLLITLMIIILFTGFVSFFIIQLFPVWVILTMAFLAILFLLRPLIKLLQGDHNLKIGESYQKPLERAAALALVLQYLVPWLNQLFNLGLFK